MKSRKNPPNFQNRSKEYSLGATGYNYDADYLGLRVLMKPSKFLELVPPGIREDNSYLEEYVKSEKPIGSPYLIIKIPDNWLKKEFYGNGDVISHEGRHRTKAILKIFGDNPIEVHLFFTNSKKEIKNRHLNEEFVRSLNKGLYAEEYENLQGRIIKNNLIEGPLFFVLGKFGEIGER